VSPYLEYLTEPTIQWALLWTAVALLVLLLFLRKPRTIVLTSSDKGRLQISRHALNRLLEACCEQLNGVATARASVRRSSGKLRTKIRLKVRPDAKLDAIQGYLTEEIATIYRDNLGLSDQVGPILIDVVGVVPAADSFTDR
jgi:hypothetical protein